MLFKQPRNKYSPIRACVRADQSAREHTCHRAIVHHVHLEFFLASDAVCVSVPEKEGGEALHYQCNTTTF